MVNCNGGVCAIAVSLFEKGYAQRDRVVGGHFAYLSLLRHQRIQHHYFNYFDETAHVLDQDFRFPMMTRNIDYIKWLVDFMLWVPMQHVLDAPYQVSKLTLAQLGAAFVK